MSQSNALVPCTLAMSLCAILASCGAKSGLEVDRTASRDAQPDDAQPHDAAPACPFDFDETVDATVRITADDNFRLFAQGALVDDTPRIWTEVQTYVVPVFRHPGHRSSIAIEGTNTMRIDGLDRGVIAELVLEIDGRRTLTTDSSWRLSTAPETGWTEVDFDATGWDAPTVEGVNGIPPWGAVLGSSRAMWLWSYDSAIRASAKPVSETIALRRDFFVDMSGALRDTPGPCP